jgi:transposase
MTEAGVDYKSLYLQKEKQVTELQVQVAALSHQLSELQRLIFGSRHERLSPAQDNPHQLSLGIQADAVAAPRVTPAQTITFTRTTAKPTESKCHPVRLKLPEHLERRDVTIEPEGEVSGLRRIGEEITEELDYEPGRLFVRRIIRPKYVSADNNSILIAPMIDRPLPKAIAGAGLLTQIVIDKYVDHLPLNRQMERLKREGVPLSYSTLTDWVSGTAKLLEPLYEALKKEVIQSDYLHADETPIKVLDREKKATTHRGYFWVYHSSIKDLVLFDYQMGRGREGPKAMLQNFKGHLQTDGYAAYDIFSQKEGITLFHCMAHARRKFFEAQANDVERAGYALSQIQLLYAIERTCKEKNFSEEQTCVYRQKESVPILTHLGEWMRTAYQEVLPKSAMGEALAYSLKRWKELVLYTSDGKLSIDNNPVERSIRTVAVGRKNYLFCGSHEAAQRSAMLYSLMGTCKLHDSNPFVYLCDVLTRIATHPINKIQDLLPHNWKPTQ